MNTPRSAKVFCRNRDVLLSLSLLLKKAVCKEGMRGSSIPSKGWWDDDDDDGCCRGEVWWGRSLGVGGCGCGCGCCCGCEGVADDEGVEETTENLKKKTFISI